MITEIIETKEEKKLSNFKSNYADVLFDLDKLHQREKGSVTVGEIKEVFKKHGVSGQYHIKLIELSNCCDV